MAQDNQFNCIVDLPRNALAPQNSTSIPATVSCAKTRPMGLRGHAVAGRETVRHGEGRHAAYTHDANDADQSKAIVKSLEASTSLQKAKASASSAVV
jgi:hypothetical protein